MWAPTPRRSSGLAARAELDDAFDRLARCGAEPELVALSRRCLAARPDDRPRDAGIVASAMTGYLRGMQERLRQAELQRVEAQARASEEKTRRRLAVGLAAAVVGLVVTAGGGGAWSLHQHHVRAARVDPLIREAEMLEAQAEAAGDDLARWAAAREAVRRALSVVHDARDAATRAGSRRLAEQVGKQADAAESDARLLDRLAEVREAIDEIPAAQTEAAYAAEFRAAGLVPDTRHPEETGRAIARRPASNGRGARGRTGPLGGPAARSGRPVGAGRITAAARAADPDDYRGRLRTALMEPRAQARRAALRDLARSAPAAELPPVTAALLGAGLLCAGDPTAAESVLRPAQRRHPADPWLAQVLAKTLEKQSRTDEAIRYYFIARAADPNRPTPWLMPSSARVNRRRRSPSSARRSASIRGRAAPLLPRQGVAVARSSPGGRRGRSTRPSPRAAKALRAPPTSRCTTRSSTSPVSEPGRLDAIVAAYRDADPARSQ